MRTRNTLLAITFLLAVTLLTYLPALHLGFVNFDDPGWVTSNPAVLRGLCPASIRYAFTTIDMGSYNPLTWLSLELDATLFPHHLAPAMHAMNGLLHATNTVLVWVILRHMRFAPAATLMAAAVFGVHPLHVESVAWVTERKDVLCAFFFLLAVHGYLRRSRTVALWFLLSLLAKPMAVTLPAVLLLLDGWPLRQYQTQPLRWLVVEKWPLWTLAIAASLGTLLAQHAGGLMLDTAHVPPAARSANAVVAYAGYLAHFFWPVRLAAYYPYQHWPAAVVARSVVLLLVVTVVASAHRATLVGWLWFLGTLVPTIGLVQVGGQAMADRYLYLPMIGLLIMGVSLAQHHRAAVVTSAAAVFVLAALTVRQIGFWQNTQTLFTHALAVTGPNAIPHIQLGLDDASAGNAATAAMEYQRAIAIDPTYFVPEFDLANLLRADAPAAAAAHYARAAALRPGVSKVENNWGLSLLATGHLREATLHFERAIADDPNDPTPRRNLQRLRQMPANSRP